MINFLISHPNHNVVTPSSEPSHGDGSDEGVTTYVFMQN